MDQGDWKTDLLSLDPSSPERPAEQSPQNLKKSSHSFEDFEDSGKSKASYRTNLGTGVAPINW